MLLFFFEKSGFVSQRDLVFIYCLLWLMGSMEMETYAQTTDEQLQKLIIENCRKFTGSEASLENAPEFCLNSITSLVGGAGNGLITVLVEGAGGGSNAGVIGAQSRVSNLPSSWQREKMELRVKERLEEEEEENSTRGGGSSADFLYDKWSIFTTERYAKTERNSTDLENGYESDLRQARFGLDYQFSEQFITGGMVGYWDAETDFNGAAGHLDTEALSVTFYGIYMPDERAYIDAYVGYMDLDYDSDRNISFARPFNNFNSVAKGSTEGDQLLVGLGATYNYWYYGAWTFVPGIKINYLETNIDGYSEKGGDGFALSYDDQNISSVVTNLDLSALYTKTFTWGALIPKGRFSYIHEFKDDERSISGFLSQLPSGTISIDTDNPDRNYYIGGVGASVVMHRGLQLFINYNKLWGHDFLDIWTISGGLRIEL